jgi:hypothetical protein
VLLSRRQAQGLRVGSLATPSEGGSIAGAGRATAASGRSAHPRQIVNGKPSDCRESRAYRSHDAYGCRPPARRPA